MPPNPSPNNETNGNVPKTRLRIFLVAGALLVLTAVLTLLFGGVATALLAYFGIK